MQKKQQWKINIIDLNTKKVSEKLLISDRADRLQIMMHASQISQR